MNTILDWIRKSFDFSQTEARGFIVLLAIIAFFVITPFVCDWLFEPKYLDSSQDQHLLDSLVTAWNKLEVAIPIKNQKNIHKHPSFYRPVKFNPNTASSERLLQVGLPQKVIKGIINYRKKGGIFRCKKDIAKMYGMNTKLYLSLEKYITLPDSIVVVARKAKMPTAIFKKDINLADTTDLKVLKGIGSKLSNRIIKYREALGGFVLQKQLEEVYGLDSFALSQLYLNFFIDDKQIVKLNINNATLEQLIDHPYLGKRYASKVVNYRKNHEQFKMKEDLEKVLAIPLQTWEKLYPYLEF